VIYCFGYYYLQKKFKKKKEFETPPMKITKALVTWLCIFMGYLGQMPLLDDFKSVFTALFGLHAICP